MTSLTDRTAALSAVRIFSTTPAEALRFIAPLLEEVSVAAGQRVFERGEMGDAMYIIEQGRMIVHDGARELDNLGPGEVFGEMAALDPEPRSASVTAQETSTLWRLNQEALAASMRQHPEIRRGVIRILSERLRHLVASMSADFVYMQQFARLTAAAVASERGVYQPESLDDLAGRADELGQLGRVFQQMIRELARRDQQMRDQLVYLEMEFDSAKKARELTETKAFHDLQQQARRLRQRQERQRPAPVETATREAAPTLPPHPDLDRARQYVIERLGRELAPTYTYHALSHTLHDVVPAAERLATWSGIEGEDLLLLRTAALFHDIGFVSRSENHEVMSVDIARTVLPGLGYQPGQIDAICGIIMATRLPQSPRTFLEQIMADADLDVLGRADFIEQSAALRAEMAANGSVQSDCEWRQFQYQFLRQHRYHTAAGRALRQDGKEANLATLARLIENCPPQPPAQSVAEGQPHD